MFRPLFQHGDGVRVHSQGRSKAQASGIPGWRKAPEGGPVMIAGRTRPRQLALLSILFIPYILVPCVGCRKSTTRGRIVRVTFSEDPNDNYGYDAYEDMTAEYATRDPVIRPGPPHDVVSVACEGAAVPNSTTVRVTIEGATPEQVFFEPSVERAFSVDEHASGTPLCLTIQGGPVHKHEDGFVEARVGSATGPVCGRLRVCVYNLYEPARPCRLFHVADDTAPLNFTPDLAALRDYANARYAQAVMRIRPILGQSTAVNVDYDFQPPNGFLDLIYGSERECPETRRILARVSINTRAEQGIIHVHDIRRVYIFDGNQDPSTGQVKLVKPPGHNFREIREGKRYTIEDWSPLLQVPPGTAYRLTIVVDRINRGTGLITLRGTYPSLVFPDGMSGLVRNITGLSGNPLFAEDADTEEKFKGTVTHEMGHALPRPRWRDVAPIDNVMHGYRRLGREKLRYRPLPEFYEEPPDEKQWSKLRRTPLSGH